MASFSGVSFSDGAQRISDGRYTMYHGTTIDKARSIVMEGFRQSSDGLLGRGVYLSADVRKAERYPVGIDRSYSCIVKAYVNVGKVKSITEAGGLQKTWHQNGYDTAWVPPNCGMPGIRSGLQENCVYDPNRIQVVELIGLPPDQVGTSRNANGYTARLGSTGKYYCGMRFNGPDCSCCDGYCGPDNGCNCSACMKLDVDRMRLCSGWLVNREGCPSRRSKGVFYCGRRVMIGVVNCDGYCGPTDGPSCVACRILQWQSGARYHSVGSSIYDEPTDRIETTSNANGHIARLGSTGKYYCGMTLDGQRCGCCDGYCGPTNGCNCSACMKLDVGRRWLPPGWLVNRDGCPARKSQGIFYCGRRVLVGVVNCDGYCGPTNGPNCVACQILQQQVGGRYRFV